MASETESAQTYGAFEWSKAIEVGHADIDGQHQKLFALLRDLKENIGNFKENKAIKAGIDGLKAYAATHFEFEEIFMNSFDYDERASHLAAHAAFIKNVESLDRSLGLKKSSADSYGKLIDFIYNWLISHINVIDRTMIAKSSGRHQEVFASHEVAAQTSNVIEDAFIVAGEVERVSARLSVAQKPAQQKILTLELKDASERLINLLNLAEMRLQIFGCSDSDLTKLRGMQGAMNSSAKALLRSAAKDLIDYAAHIVLGKKNLPLGAGTFMSRKAYEIERLLQLVGGVNNLDDAMKENVTQALSFVSEVTEIETQTLGMKDYSPQRLSGQLTESR